MKALEQKSNSAGTDISLNTDSTQSNQEINSRWLLTLNPRPQSTAKMSLICFFPPNGTEHHPLPNGMLCAVNMHGTEVTMISFPGWFGR